MKVDAVLAPGIYRMDNGSYRVVARVGARTTGPRPKEKRFPAGSALKAMRSWQEAQRVELRRENLRPVLGTLAADIDRYLEKPEVKALASYKTRISDVRTWLAPLGHLRRDQISPAMVQEAIAHQQHAVWTIRHRLNALSQVYIVLDGLKAHNPVSEVIAPPKPRSIPRALDYDTIRTVLNQMEPSATKGFLMIMAFCGFRPSEIRRTEPWMLHLEATPVPYCIRNTSKGGDVVPVPLSEEGVLAWTMFTHRAGLDKSAGPRTFPNANRDWKLAMVRAGFKPTRCYDLVHSYCTVLLMEGGGDISMVQKARGHRDIRTTLMYTQVVVDPRLATAVQRAFRVAGRRGSDAK